MVATQKIQVGLVHAGKIVTVTAEDHAFRLLIDGQVAGVVPRTTTSEIHRYKRVGLRTRTHACRYGRTWLRSPAGRLS